MTGDNEYVTRKVAQDVGLTAARVLVGSDVDQTDDAALAVQAEHGALFARVSPEQKNRVMTALRARGRVVGFMGDGINDAPSLHAADIGISVMNAVDVAKDAASIILLEKDLRVLHDGVVEGRRSFANILKYIIMGTSSNFGNMFSMAAASLFLPFLPMLPTQTLVVFVIRTAGNPLRSRPSRAMVAGVTAVVLIGLLWAYTPLGPWLGFDPPPASLLLALIVLTITYLALVQAVKTRFYRRYGLGG